MFGLNHQVEAASENLVLVDLNLEVGVDRGVFQLNCA